jgi:hypothetical protein
MVSLPCISTPLAGLAPGVLETGAALVAATDAISDGDVGDTVPSLPRDGWKSAMTLTMALINAADPVRIPGTVVQNLRKRPLLLARPSAAGTGVFPTCVVYAYQLFSDSLQDTAAGRGQQVLGVF